MKRIYYFKIANRYFNMNAMQDYKKSVLATLQLCADAKDTLGLGKANSYLGDYYASKLIADSAYLYYFRAEKLYKKIKDNNKIAKTILTKSVLQLNEKDYIGCEKSAFEALKYLRKDNDTVLTFQAYNFLGVIYGELHEYDKALEFHTKAFDLVKSEKIPAILQTKAMSLNNIGLVYQNQMKHKKAIDVFNLALNQENLFKENPALYAILINNLGYSMLKIDDLKKLPRFFYDSLKISDSLKSVSNSILSNLNLSEYYAFKKDNSKARSFAMEAYALAKSNHLSKDVLQCLKQLTAVIPEKSMAYSLAYIHINDSLQIAERKIRNKLARIEFETEELAIEKDNLLVQQQYILFIGLGLLLFVGLLVIIGFQSAKNRELILKQEQQKANEEVYQIMLHQQEKIEEGKQLVKKRISQELHDGIMGRLSSIRLNLFVLEKKTDQETIHHCLDYIKEIQNVENDIRTISHELNTSLFSVENDFTEIVEKLFSTITNHADIEFKLDVEAGIVWTTINSTTKMHLYRILQEALQNIDKYAKASEVSITILDLKKAIAIAIKDNGKGFDTTTKSKGIGIANMKARAETLHGQFEIESKKDEGTIINLILPI